MHSREHHAIYAALAIAANVSSKMFAVPLGFELELRPQQQAQLPLQKSKGAEGPASDWLAARK
jgi:hypothetical protein